jgi:HAD superfamily hydrolase (TIGR01509 family)
MSHLKAIIFDVDGTLADTERDGHRVAFNRAFADAKLSWKWSVDRYGQLLSTGGGKERLQRYVREDWPEFKLGLSVYDWAVAVHKMKTQHYTTLIQEGFIPLRPGVKRFISEAREAGIRLAIATTSAPENVTALLETCLAPNSARWFEVIAAGDIVPAKKPAPDIYRYVLKALQLPADHCIAIEDSNQGLRAALRAGIKTVITRSTYTQLDDFTGASLVVDHLGDRGLPMQVYAGTAHGDCFDLQLAQALLTSKP